MVTHTDTMWLYPLQYVEQALAETNIPHRYDGVHIVCPTLQNIADIYYEIFLLTADVIPDGPGFNIGIGTLLQDYGREIQWRTEDNSFWIHWRLVKQISEQGPGGGASPIGTVGFIITIASYGDTIPEGYTAIFERCLTMRLG